MTAFNRYVLLLVAAAGLGACDSRSLDPNRGDGGPGGSGGTGIGGTGVGGTGVGGTGIGGTGIGGTGIDPVDAATDACPGTGGAITRATIPTEHRATAAACSPSTRAPAPPDAGLMSCTSHGDCATDGSLTYFSSCLHGVCSFDQCLSDSDCGATDVCACANDYYGGNTAYHANVCVHATCRVDADCGAGGYCSPSHGHCGTFEGFYCHGPSDTCVDSTVDCAGCGKNACVYAPTVGAFVCGINVCGG